MADEAETRACRELLASGTVEASPAPPIRGADVCGIAAPVALAAVIAEGRRIEVEPRPLMRCDLAAALARWIAEDVAPAFASQGTPLKSVVTADAYSCRTRNNQPGAKISEHARGGAVDIAAFVIGEGRREPATGQGLTLAPLIKAAACARFTTVLGPGSDGFHETHVHLDLEERRRQSSLCQWTLR